MRWITVEEGRYHHQRHGFTPTLHPRRAGGKVMRERKQKPIFFIDIADPRDIVLWVLLKMSPVCIDDLQNS
jgi:glutamyl-tRNA reductase